MVRTNSMLLGDIITHHKLYFGCKTGTLRKVDKIFQGETCWFISMKIPPKVSSSSTTTFPFFNLVVLGFLLGFPAPFAYNHISKLSFKKK